MKKFAAMILICFCILIFMGALTGCSKEGADSSSTEKSAVCFVVGGHANSQGLNMNSPLVQDTVYSTVRNYGFIGVVSVDGNPEVIHAASYDIDDKFKSASPDRLDMDARSKATNIIVSMQNVIANDPEVDYLQSLHQAVRILTSLEGYDSKQIIVLGTGLNTTGVLDFNNNLISAEPDVVVELLKEKSEIPNFSGITVYWQQLSDVAAPQQALTSVQRDKLQQIYAGIVEAGGGTFVYNDIIANPVNESGAYPSVTPVELPEDTPIHFEPEELESEEGDKAFEEPWILGENKVEFMGDQSTYLFPEKAVENIRPIAEYLNQHESVKLLLIGSTAGDVTNEYTLKLSQERADVVKNTLVELGVDASRIIAVGMGSSDPWHVLNAGYEGAAASGNRKCVLLDSRSATAQSILEQMQS